MDTIHGSPFILQFGFTFLDNMIKPDDGSNRNFVLIKIITNFESQSFLLGGCVKPKHDSNNFQSRNKIFWFSQLKTTYHFYSQCSGHWLTCLKSSLHWCSYCFSREDYCLHWLLVSHSETRSFDSSAAVVAVVDSGIDAGCLQPTALIEP